MKSIINKFLQEPLFHFLLFGAFVYLFYTHYNPQQESISPQKITIILTQSEKKHLTQNFQQQYHYKPSQELISLLERYDARQKALLAEAYRLQLYKNDPKIEKILLEKMHYILQKQKSSKEISEEKLLNYYKEHIQAYVKRGKISFYYLYLKNTDIQKADKLYKLFKYQKAITSLPKELNATTDYLTQKYGSYFSRQLLNAPIKRWLAPIAVKSGFMLVYIFDTKENNKPLDFEEVEDRVYQDYIYYKERENYLTQEKKLHKRYLFDIKER